MASSSQYDNQDGASNHQQNQPSSSSTTAGGGIGSSINPQLPLNPPPPTNNSLGSGNTAGGGGGMINVDNIFASMTPDTTTTTTPSSLLLLGGGGDGTVPSAAAGGGANNIFQNFANTNTGPTMPVRKYSDSTASYYYRGGRNNNNNVIPAASVGGGGGMGAFASGIIGAGTTTTTTTTTTGASGPPIARTESDGLSKSMGAASFLLKAKGGHKSFSESDPSPTIRYAGYLLKRSNLPFAPPGTSSMPMALITTTSMDNITAAAAASLGEGVGGIAPLPDLNALDNNDTTGGEQQDHEFLFALPFGGFDESMVGIDDIDSPTNNNIGLSNILSGTTRQQQQSMMVNPAISTTSTPATTDEETSDEQPMESTSTLNEEPCFCSPIVEYFGKLFHTKTPSSRKDALVSSDYMGSTTRMSNVSKNKKSTVKKSSISSKKKKSTSPRPTTQPLPITPTQLSPASSNMATYNMPLKGPAPIPKQRSEPVPISPPVSQNRSIVRVGSGNEISSRGSGNQLSQSYSNGGSGQIGKGILSTVASSSTAATPASVPAPQKVYPPPPPSYIDPKDGHIWRSKYCILEHGILYFYRTATEGESEEARIEREESREYDQVGEEIVLGEEPSAFGSPRTSFASAPGGGGARSSRLSFSKLRSSDRKNSGDLFDLSKSPMPYKKSDFFPNLRNSPFHRQGSSVITRGSSMSDSQRSSDVVRGASGGNNDFDERPTPTRSSPLLHHSNSTSTFHHDADILWEKRVALDCVGAVHSSPEYGGHVFELLAYGTDEARDEDGSDVSTRASGSRGGRPQQQQEQQEVIDRLVLRAGSPDEMNSWMFQFHCSLSSFLQQNLQQIVNSVRSGDQTGKSMVHGADITRAGSPKHASSGIGSIGHHHYRVASLGPFVHKQSFASSPTTAGGGGGGGSFHESFSPNVVGSLSHGHGRNALYRRQVRDKSASSGVMGAISPLPTPIGTPLGGSSPVDVFASDSRKKPLLMIQSDTSKVQGKIDLPSLKDLRGEEMKKLDVESKAAQEPKKAAPKGRYIPPHLRRKMAAEAAAAESSGTSASDAIAIPEGPAVEKEVQQIALNDMSAKEPSGYADKRNGNGRASSLEESLSDSAFSAGSTSSMLSRQLDEDADFPMANIRLGGCADPTVIVGSIVDHLYIDRKASVVGNARLEAYGCTGGGHYESFDGTRHGYGHRSSAQEEEDVSMMLMNDVLDKEKRSVLNNEAANNNQRSVLKWEVGASSECGIRNSNEDAYVVINNLDDLIQTQGLVSFSQQDLGHTKQQGLFAIFDGHVGNQAARYSAEKFPAILMEEESVLASQDSAYISSIEDRADTILRKAFDRLDREFCSLCTEDGRNWDSGSTALVALIVDDVVSLANLGDCQGVVCRAVLDGVWEATAVRDGWEALDSEQQLDEGPVWDRANGGGDAYTSTPRGQLFWKEVTEAHSPLLDEERARIEAANGWIIQETDIPIGQLHRMDMFDKDVVEIVRRCFADRMKEHRSDPVRQIQIARTCGDLAVSRAIGDRDFKADYNIPPNKTELARSWEGPPVFLFPEGHSGRFRGDIVSNVPEIKTFKVGQEGVVDEFLLMACDGLWDVMDGDDAVRIAKDLLFDKKLSAKDGAARLAELAQHLGSSDNITVILIRFYWEECND